MTQVSEIEIDRGGPDGSAVCWPQVRGPTRECVIPHRNRTRDGVMVYNNLVCLRRCLHRVDIRQSERPRRQLLPFIPLSRSPPVVTTVDSTLMFIGSGAVSNDPDASGIPSPHTSSRERCDVAGTRRQGCIRLKSLVSRFKMDF